LEVENKSATPYSSRRAREGPGKKIFSSFSFLPSTFLDPSENLRRIDKTTHKEITTVNMSNGSLSLLAITTRKVTTSNSTFSRAHSEGRDVE
jgi:hypothetical protein